MSRGSNSRVTAQNALRVDARQSLLRKTKLCSFYQAGVCSRGGSCTYAHSLQELMQQPDFSKTRLCESYMISGMCAHGNLCKFAHGVGDLREIGKACNVAQETSADLSQPATRSPFAESSLSVEDSELMTLQNRLAQLTEQNMRKCQEMLQRRSVSLLKDSVIASSAPVSLNSHELLMPCRQVALHSGSAATSTAGTPPPHLNLEALYRHQVAFHPQGVAASFDPRSLSLQQQHATVQLTPSAVSSTTPSQLDAELLQRHQTALMPQTATASCVPTDADFHIEQSQLYHNAPQPGRGAISACLTSSRLCAEQPQRYQATSQHRCAEASAVPVSSKLETEPLQHHQAVSQPVTSASAPTRWGASGDTCDGALISLRQCLRMWSCDDKVAAVNIRVRNTFLSFESEESQPGSNIRSRSLPKELDMHRLT
eukprot:TRINITY_DN9545_c0_g2_i1.p1 TRINITY_DN9545_c0_g2~~TRINITY_DN9545_c0_g2_i1.p1  ORF type:complete len:427 (+),score=59.59 TRINITY_DN9545_c0_g2_i1:54-1334(+)